MLQSTGGSDNIGSSCDFEFLPLLVLKLVKVSLSPVRGFLLLSEASRPCACSIVQTARDFPFKVALVHGLHEDACD